MPTTLGCAGGRGRPGHPPPPRNYYETQYVGRESEMQCPTPGRPPAEDDRSHAAAAASGISQTARRDRCRPGCLDEFRTSTNPTQDGFDFNEEY